MRTNVPEAFSLSFEGPEGAYTIYFQPTDEWDGTIDVSLAGQQMRWDVLDADRGDDGSLTLGGMTSGSESIWSD